MSIPSDLKYTRSHEWIRDNGDGSFTLGVTHHAQDQLGDVVFWEGPAKGEAFSAEDGIGVVESVKAVSDVYAPVEMIVVESNPALEDSPELINTDPYGEGWMVKFTSSDAPGLMEAGEYKAFVAEIS